MYRSFVSLGKSPTENINCYFFARTVYTRGIAVYFSKVNDYCRPYFDLFLFLGELTFSYVFRVELYSFQITCGAVLIYNGLSGLLKGFFLKVDEHIKLADLTTVPIAIPMIAGPATITAAVTFPVQYGREITIIAILIALVINLFCMLQARRIGNFLIKYNFMNPLIRIIGLIVATIGLQMVFDGITLFIRSLA